jgi:hypothetical protein
MARTAVEGARNARPAGSPVTGFMRPARLRQLRTERDDLYERSHPGSDHHDRKYSAFRVPTRA